VAGAPSGDPLRVTADAEEDLTVPEGPGRSRRRRAVGLVAALGVAGALVAVAWPVGDGRSEIATVPGDDARDEAPGTMAMDERSTSSTPTGPTATAATDPTGELAPTVPEETTASTTTTDGSATDPTTSTTVCADSFDPACGTFRWSSAVRANQPMTASIELLTPNPVAGELFEVRIVASDPDATPDWRLAGGWFSPAGAEDDLSPANCSFHGTETAYGPSTPPEPRPGRLDRVYQLRTHDPGTYWVTACIPSMSWVVPVEDAGAHAWTHWCPGDGRVTAFEGSLCRDPYADFATPHIEVIVGPAP
jgi:hypothetical protein